MGRAHCKIHFRLRFCKILLLFRIRASQGITKITISHRYFNPLLYDEVTTCQPTTLSGSEAIVIYRIKNTKPMIKGTDLNNALGNELKGNDFSGRI